MMSFAADITAENMRRMPRRNAFQVTDKLVRLLTALRDNPGCKAYKLNRLAEHPFKSTGSLHYNLVQAECLGWVTREMKKNPDYEDLIPVERLRDMLRDFIQHSEPLRTECGAARHMVEYLEGIDPEILEVYPNVEAADLENLLGGLAEALQQYTRSREGLRESLTLLDAHVNSEKHRLKRHPRQHHYWTITKDGIAFVEEQQAMWRQEPQADEENGDA